MIVSKWGDSLAVRLSDDDVARLGLKEGDEVVVEVKRAEPPPTEPDQAEIARREALLLEMRRFRGALPADFKFDREEANER
jgi:antitoxin MazE